MTDATHTPDLDLEEQRIRIRHYIVDIDAKLVDMDLKLQQKAMEPWKVFSIIVGSAGAFLAAGAAIFKALVG